MKRSWHEVRQGLECGDAEKGDDSAGEEQGPWLKEGHDLLSVDVELYVEHLQKLVAATL